jgi:hypothetical protein
MEDLGREIHYLDTTLELDDLDPPVSAEEEEQHSLMEAEIDQPLFQSERENNR